MEFASIILTLTLLCNTNPKSVFVKSKSTHKLPSELRSCDGNELLPRKPEAETNAEATSSLVTFSRSLDALESEGSSQTHVDTSLHPEAGDVSDEEGIGEVETTSDKVWRSQSGERAVRIRVLRSPQEFDDDVETSSSEERGNRGKGKAKGKQKGKEKEKKKGKGKSYRRGD